MNNSRTQLRFRRQRGFTHARDRHRASSCSPGSWPSSIPKIFEQGAGPRRSEAKIRIQQLAGQIELYKLEVGKYPESLQDARARSPAALEGKWTGPYVKEADLKDAWGNDYRYTVPGTGKTFDIISLGADGKEGGDGENRDITN